MKPWLILQIVLFSAALSMSSGLDARPHPAADPIEKIKSSVAQNNEKLISISSIDRLLRMFGEEWDRVRLNTLRRMLGEGIFAEEIDVLASVEKATDELLANASMVISLSRNKIKVSVETIITVDSNIAVSRRLRAAKTAKEREDLQVLSGLVETLVLLHEELFGGQNLDDEKSLTTNLDNR